MGTKIQDNGLVNNKRGRSAKEPKLKRNRTLRRYMNPSGELLNEMIKESKK